MLPGFIATMGALIPAKPLQPRIRLSPVRSQPVVTANRWAWAIQHAASLTAISLDRSSTYLSWQVSLLLSFDRLTIPSPTTSLPFRRGRFGTLLHRHGLPRRYPLERVRSRTFRSHGQGFIHSQEAPRQAWPNRVRLRYGLVIRRRLLPTLLHRNAVTTVDYRPVTLAWRGLSPLGSNASVGVLERLSEPSRPRGSVSWLEVKPR